MEQLSLKKGESLKQKESTKNAKPEPQFKAKIGSSSHQRTHNHTGTNDILYQGGLTNNHFRYNIVLRHVVYYHFKNFFIPTKGGVLWSK